MSRKAAGALLAALASLAGCAHPEPPPVSETLRIALRSEPPDLDPLTSTTNLAQQVGDRIFEPLLDLDSALRPVPRLALEWEREDDGRAWRFRLRPDVRWHGGGALSAGDLAATLARALHPDTPSLDLKPLFAGAGPAQIVGPLEIRIPFDPPASDSYTRWFRLRVLPAGNASTPSGPGWQGSGPYRFVARSPGEWILLVRNPDWWGSPPSIRYLLFRIIPDRVAISHALDAGEVDLAIARLADLERARGGARPFRVVEVDTTAIYVVLWNLRLPGSPFADARVRRALTLAFDRASLVAQVRRGVGRVASTLYPRLWQIGRAAPPPLPFDPERAARLLDQAGIKDSDGDGWRERDGNVFSFRLLYTLEDDLRREIATILQSDLAGVGVRVTPERVDGAALVRRLRGHDFEAAVHAWQLDPEPRAFDFLHSTQAASGLNYAGHADPGLDRLLERELAAPDEHTRAAAGAEVEEYLLEHTPMLFVCFPGSLVAVHRRVQGFEAGPLGLLGGHPGPEAWSLAGS